MMMMTSRRYLCLLLALLVAGCTTGDSSVVQMNDGEVDEQRRELFSIWSLLNLVGIPKPPCPPSLGGPAAHGNCKPVGTQSPTSYDASADTSTYVASSQSASSYDTNVSKESSLQTRSRMSSWWYLLAAAVATVVIGAAVWGRRKMRERHMLEGSVKRRMGLFSRWADNTLCGGDAAAGGVEMTGAAAAEDKKYERMA